MAGNGNSAVQYESVNEDGSIGGFEVNFVDVDGVRTRYYETGDESDDHVLLLHGGGWYGGSSANTWVDNLAGLGEEFHVLAPDRIANGMTDNPADESDFVYETEVEHMMAFLDEMGVEQVHVIGQSRGGLLTGHLAIEDAERVDTAVVVNSASLSPEAGVKGKRRSLVQDRLSADPDDPDYLYKKKKAVKEGLAFTTDHITDEKLKAACYMQTRPKSKETERIMERKRDAFRKTVKEAKWRTHQNLKEGKLTQPILLYWGRNDPNANLDTGMNLYEQVSLHNSSTRMYIVERAGHHPYQEYPQEFERVVTNFITDWSENGETRKEKADAKTGEFRNYYNKS